MFTEDDSDGQACHTVDVHGQLEGGEMVARQEGEDAIEAGELVEDERERYQRGAGGQREGEEEGLEGCALAFRFSAMRSRRQAAYSSQVLWFSPGQTYLWPGGAQKPRGETHGCACCCEITTTGCSCSSRVARCRSSVGLVMGRVCQCRYWQRRL